MKFVNLYLQTEYSMLQSTCKIASTVELVENYNYDSIAITDEGNMHGVIKFYNACKEKNIHPIIGLKITYSHNETKHNLLLYASNKTGYVNLMKISSRSKILDGIVDLDYISRSSYGLIAVYPYFENENDNWNYENILPLQHIFHHFYIGLSYNNNDNIFRNIYDNIQNKNIKMVAIERINYLKPTEYLSYRTLKAISNGYNFTEEIDEEKYYYLKQEKDLLYKYQNYPDLINNTVEISKLCNVEFDFNQYLLPEYDANVDANEYLKELCLKGLSRRLQLDQVKNQDSYYKQLKHELETIKEMGFSDYFLIVWDYVKFAKKNNIYVGPGRGSAGGSLVSYCLGITDIDPIKYQLLFERFLNKERISMPDIDIDFPDDTRDQVIKYVGEKYGKERVAHIATFGTFKVKLALRDTAKVFKLSDTRLKQILKYLPEEHLYTTTLSKIVHSSGELLQLMDDYEDINQVLNVAMTLEGLPRNTSTHAAGIIITKNELINYTPLDKGLDDIFQTQYEASDLEKLGLLKMDFLGLRNLSIISKTVDLIKKDQSDFRLPKNENDKETFKMLASGDVWGVFQLESAGMRKVIMDMKVSAFDDIVQAIALYRPGPMEMIPTFIKRKFKLEQVIYPHPDLENILKDTYGTIVYQEQIILIACRFAGYSLGKADVLRKAVSKKNKDVLEKERIEFVNSCMNKGYTEEVANNVYDYIVKFANYGFNKAHSVAYAKVAYLTAYLKCHYLEYYLATLMSSVIGSNDINMYYKEGMKKQINFTTPNINISTEEFIVNNHSIVFPLLIINGLGMVKVKQILELRNEKPFTDFEDFVIRTKQFIPDNLLENIIFSGALDVFGLTKKAMINNYKNIINKTQYSFLPNLVENNYTTEEFTYGYLLDKEKEILGINLKYNFFYQYQDIYIKEKLLRINQLEESLNHGYRYVKTFGMIKDIKQIMTKKNEPMAFMVLEDDVSNIEMTVFPKQYLKYRHIKKGQLVKVFGTIERKQKLNLIVEEIGEMK